MGDADPNCHATTLAAHPRSVRAARKFFVGVAEGLGLESEHVALGELAVSELVSNAVLHTGEVMTVRVCRTAEGVRVEVADRSSAEPKVAEFDPGRSGGRGLAIVAAVAGRWGFESDSYTSGKVVWFTLPIPDPDIRDSDDICT